MLETKAFVVGVVSTMGYKDGLHAVVAIAELIPKPIKVSQAEPIRPEFLGPFQVINQLNQDPVRFRFYICMLLYLF